MANDGIKDYKLRPTRKNGGYSASNPQQKGRNIYDLEYFSNGQAALYIGDVFVDEVTSFQYRGNQSKTPIYGYASQLFDVVSKGTYLIEGSFTVNFKESGYLWLILHRYKQFQNTMDTVLSQFGDLGKNNVSALEFMIGNHKEDGFEPVLGGVNIPFVRLKNSEGNEIDRISRAGIERLVTGEASRDERFQFYTELTGYATTTNKYARDRVFENIVEAFEDQVWNQDVSDLDSMARRADDNYFDNFDMFLTFGDYTKPGANHTVRRIRGVHITSQGQQVDLGDGSGIQELYTFFARNIV